MKQQHLRKRGLITSSLITSCYWLLNSLKLGYNDQKSSANAFTFLKPRVVLVSTTLNMCLNLLMPSIIFLLQYKDIN